MAPLAPVSCHLLVITESGSFFIDKGIFQAPGPRSRGRPQLDRD